MGFLLQLCENVTQLARIIWLLHVTTHSCRDQYAAVSDASTHQHYAKKYPFPIGQRKMFVTRCAKGCKSSCDSEAPMVEGSLLLRSPVSTAVQQVHSSQDRWCRPPSCASVFL